MEENFRKKKERPAGIESRAGMDLAGGIKKVVQVVRRMNEEGARAYIEIGEKKLSPAMKADYKIGIKFLDDGKKKKSDKVYD